MNALNPSWMHLQYNALLILGCEVCSWKALMPIYYCMCASYTGMELWCFCWVSNFCVCVFQSWAGRNIPDWLKKKKKSVLVSATKGSHLHLLVQLCTSQQWRFYCLWLVSETQLTKKIWNDDLCRPIDIKTQCTFSCGKIKVKMYSWIWQLSIY